jgi:hypothetical membrane protein
MINRKILVYAGSAACFIGCIGDFLSLFILGSHYPGYSQLHNTMSSLGSTASPVSGIISAMWVILGLLMIVFAFGFKEALPRDDKYVKAVFWLLILYGLGEGAGSGLFKADTVSGTYTISFIVHDILGSAGLIAILILPLIVQKIKPYFSGRCFLRYSVITVVSGTLFLVLFSFRFIGNETNALSSLKGLWQRLFVLVYYIYLTVLAIKMIRITVLQGK